MAAPLEKVLCQISRMCVSSTGKNVCRRSISTQGGPKCFWATPVQLAAPMKKKKRMDPGIMLQREQRKRKRLEKEIRRLEKRARKLKPIEEIEGERAIMKTLELRTRVNPPMSFEEGERRALLIKDWSRYKRAQHVAEMNAIKTAMRSQEKALQELRKESEELYQQAIQIDPNLIPFERKGPVATPPIPDFDPVDGDYTDTTKVYDK